MGNYFLDTQYVDIVDRIHALFGVGSGSWIRFYWGTLFKFGSWFFLGGRIWIKFSRHSPHPSPQDNILCSRHSTASKIISLHDMKKT